MQGKKQGLDSTPGVEGVWRGSCDGTGEGKSQNRNCWPDGDQTCSVVDNSSSCRSRRRLDIKLCCFRSSCRRKGCSLRSCRDCLDNS